MSDWQSHFGIYMHHLDIHVLCCFVLRCPLVPREPGQVVAPQFAISHTIGIGLWMSTCLKMGGQSASLGFMTGRQWA